MWVYPYPENRGGKGKQNHISVDFGRQLIDVYDPEHYSDEIKRECLDIYVNGMDFFAIKKVEKVHYTRVINLVKQVAQVLPDAPE